MSVGCWSLWLDRRDANSLIVAAIVLCSKSSKFCSANKRFLKAIPYTEKKITAAQDGPKLGILLPQSGIPGMCLHIWLHIIPERFCVSLSLSCWQNDLVCCCCFKLEKLKSTRVCNSAMGVGGGDRQKALCFPEKCESLFGKVFCFH